MATPQRRAGWSSGDGSWPGDGADLVHREYTGRPRSYVMKNEASPGLPLPAEEPIGIDGMVAEVVNEMQNAIDRLPQVSTDPRLDRLVAGAVGATAAPP